MSTYISRRRVVAGAAWAAPVIATSAAVPAFAASLDCVFADSPHKFLRGYSDYRVEEEFTVPANVSKLRFDIFGGGGVSDTGHESGSGARTTGIVEVKPGQTVRIIAGGGSGGNYHRRGRLTTDGPGRGGRGYGDGGDAPRFTMPAEVVAEVTKRYPGALNWRELEDGPKGTVEVYGHPGGGASALLIDGEVIAVAGGGGGGGVTYSYTSAPHAKHFPAVLDASVTNFYHPTDPPIRSFAGSGLSTRGGDATTGTQFYTHSLKTLRYLLTAVRAETTAQVERVLLSPRCRPVAPTISLATTARITRCCTALRPQVTRAAPALRLRAVMVLSLIATSSTIMTRRTLKC